MQKAALAALLKVFSEQNILNCSFTGNLTVDVYRKYLHILGEHFTFTAELVIDPLHRPNLSPLPFHHYHHLHHYCMFYR